MTCVFDNPEEFARTALAGFASVHSRNVWLVNGGVVRSTAAPQGKVAVVVGGGSGHYPAFAGFVGPGLADGAVAGDIFASPSTHLAVNVCRKAHHGGGVLLGFGKYAGDVFNFGLAAERLISEGIDVRLLPVTDDVASAPPEKANERRGVAGDLTVFKIAGAAAEAGMNLDEVERVAIKANQNTVSFGVAFSGCTLPGAGEPLFTVPPRRVGVGLGIHGEPGISEIDLMPASELAETLVKKLVVEKPAWSDGRVAVILNGLGNTKYEELFVLWASVETCLKKAGLSPIEPEVGEYVTSLDMAGCSLTLTWLDDELEKFWRAPSDAPVLRRGQIIPTQSIPAPLDREEAPEFGPASAVSKENGKCIAGVLDKIAAALRDAEAELGRIDARAGDGDHGQGMTRGSAAAAEAAQQAVAAGAGAASVLAAAANAWADRAGGASGALWGLALRTLSTQLSDEAELTANAVAQGVRAGLNAVVRLGGAKIGDKTLIDAFAPFADALNEGVAKGQPLTEAWANAADAATRAAEATAQLTPKLGRAKSHTQRSLGHPDAGAISLALVARTVAEAIKGQSPG
ncbi:MAG: dihydroxyacetone kinase family protein [Candidatus Accumulibacter sp.]|jgi:dihydroxyacetone kinase|nr:dihydroxyacetone kinase family protein [Accumulibacter sp.]